MEATAEITAAVKNVPALRFPEFEGEWEEGKLKGLIKSIDSGWSPQCEGVPAGSDEWGVLKTTSVVWEGFNESENKRLPDKFEPREEIQVRVNDILITRAGPTNRVGVTAHVDKIRPKLMLSDKLVRLRTNDENNSKFIAISLAGDHAQKQLMSKSSGLATSQTNISQSIILNTKLVYPSKEEQQKIASFLSAVDDKIQQLSKKNALLEKYKKGVMQQIFSQQIRFKDDNGNAFPEWEEKKLIEIGKRVTLKNKKSDINFVLTNSATQGIVSQQEYFDKDVANQENLEGYYVVDVDDFIYNPRISATAPVGPIKRNKLVKGVMSPLYTVFRFDKRNLEFLEFFFETTVWHKYMKSIANYGARHDRMSITNEDFLKLPIPQPCEVEQQKITEFLSAVDNKLNYTSKQLEQAQQFKKGLLQQLFV